VLEVEGVVERAIDGPNTKAPRSPARLGVKHPTLKERNRGQGRTSEWEKKKEMVSKFEQVFSLAQAEGKDAVRRRRKVWGRVRKNLPPDWGGLRPGTFRRSVADPGGGQQKKSLTLAGKSRG